MEYTSCNWIMHGLDFEPEHIEMCCLRCHVGGGCVIVKDSYHGEPINWDEFFGLKQKFIDDNKKGIIDPRCKGCFNLYNKNWDDQERYFSYMHFNHWTHCNCDCIYCFTDGQKEYFNKKPHYNVLPIVKDIFDKKMFKHGGEITFAGGEPTILGEFEELIDFFIEKRVSNITIHTSGVKFSPALARGIEAGLINVVVSLDAGSKEAYKKMKKFDHIEKVWENTAKYAKVQNRFNNNNVATKYILLPPINDSFEEVDLWLKNNKKAGTNSLIIDIEHEWFKHQRADRSMPPHIIQLIEHIKKVGKENNWNIILYNSARYYHDNRDYFINEKTFANPYSYKFV